MTRAEAIKVLKRMKYPYNCNKRKMIISDVNRDNEALDMAIQALSQEPCDDAISREYLKKIAQSEGAYGYVSAHDIATAPSVTQKSDKYRKEAKRWKNKWLKSQKSGKWIIKERYYHDTVTAECSECHREVEIPTCMEELMYDFCPMCGAKMESEDEE